MSGIERIIISAHLDMLGGLIYLDLFNDTNKAIKKHLQNNKVATKTCFAAKQGKMYNQVQIFGAFQLQN